MRTSKQPQPEPWHLSPIGSRVAAIRQAAKKAGHPFALRAIQKRGAVLEPWTPARDSELLRLWLRTSTSERRIAQALGGTTPAAVHWRAWKLGKTPRAYWQNLDSAG
jgi:hypothetical protein